MGWVLTRQPLGTSDAEQDVMMHHIICRGAQSEAVNMSIDGLRACARLAERLNELNAVSPYKNTSLSVPYFALNTKK